MTEPDRSIGRRHVIVTAGPDLGAGLAAALLPADAMAQTAARQARLPHLAAQRGEMNMRP